MREPNRLEELESVLRTHPTLALLLMIVSVLLIVTVIIAMGRGQTIELYRQALVEKTIASLDTEGEVLKHYNNGIDIITTRLMECGAQGEVPEAIRAYNEGAFHLLRTWRNVALIDGELKDDIHEKGFKPRKTYEI